MAATRKTVRDAIRAVLADATYGFNAAFAAVQAAYGITEPAQLEWGEGSETVFCGKLGARDAALSTLRGELTLQLYTVGSQWTGATRGVKWSGRVDAALVFTVEESYRNADEDVHSDEEAELWAEAIEDAVTEVFARRTIDWGALGVVYAKPPDCPNPQDAELLEDGWRRVVPIQVGFKVDAAY